MAKTSRRPRTKAEQEKHRAYHREYRQRRAAADPERAVKEREAAAAYARAWRKANPEKSRATDRKYKATHKHECAERFRAWKQNNPSKVKSIRDRNKAKIRAFLNETKLAAGCMDCGYKSHPAALHFDHVRGKKVRNLANMYSMPQVLRELEKCEVRCANCHAIRHYFERPHRHKEKPGA